METLVRKKPCRHCMFTKNALGTPESIKAAREGIAANRVDGKVFECHEHSERVVCCGFVQRYPEDVSNPRKIQEDGDLKHMFSNLTREEMNKFSYGLAKKTPPSQ